MLKLAKSRKVTHRFKKICKGKSTHFKVVSKKRRNRFYNWARRREIWKHKTRRKYLNSAKSKNPWRKRRSNQQRTLMNKSFFSNRNTNNLNYQVSKSYRRLNQSFKIKLSLSIGSINQRFRTLKAKLQQPKIKFKYLRLNWKKNRPQFKS